MVPTASELFSSGVEDCGGAAWANLEAGAGAVAAAGVQLDAGGGGRQLGGVVEGAEGGAGEAGGTAEAGGQCHFRETEKRLKTNSRGRRVNCRR